MIKFLIVSGRSGRGHSMSTQDNLTINEKKVLLALEELGSATPDKLEEKAGLQVDAAMQAASCSRKKNLPLFPKKCLNATLLRRKEKNIRKPDFRSVR